MGERLPRRESGTRARSAPATGRPDRGQPVGSCAPLPGRLGLDGPPGLTGLVGPPGSAGFPGLPGLTGLVGPPGCTGFEGPPGTTGLEGPPGCPGLDGPCGTLGRPGMLGAGSPLPRTRLAARLTVDWTTPRIA